MDDDAAPWILFTEDHRPHWPIDWPDIYEDTVPEECAWMSNRPATESEAAFALTLPWGRPPMTPNVLAEEGLYKRGEIVWYDGRSYVVARDEEAGWGDVLIVGDRHGDDVFCVSPSDLKRNDEISKPANRSEPEYMFPELQELPEEFRRLAAEARTQEKDGIKYHNTAAHDFNWGRRTAFEQAAQMLEERLNG